MKKQTIQITSLPKATQVSIQNGHRKLKPRLFPSIEAAIDYALPLGNRHTDLYLNGYSCVLHGWVQGPNNLSMLHAASIPQPACETVRGEGGSPAGGCIKVPQHSSHPAHP